MENTEDFKSALFPDVMKYNDQFEDDEIPEQDQGANAPLYEIDIFGKTYVIAVGTATEVVIDDGVSFYYCIVYLTHNKKPVSKIGVYEISNESLEEGEEASSLRIPFQNHDLLVHPKYYVQPHVIEPYSQSYDELDDREEGEGEEEGKEEGKENSEEIEEGEIVEDDEESQGDNENENENENEDENESDDGVISDERTKRIMKQELYNHYHDLDDNDDDKERKLTLQYMLINIYMKNIAPPSIQKKMKKEIKKIKETFFPNKNGPFISKEAIKEMELFDLSPTFLLFFELYATDIKCVIIEGNNTTQVNQFSMLGSLSEQDKEDIRKNKQDKKVFSANKAHIRLLENYDPKMVFYFTKTSDDKIEFVTKKAISELEDDEKQALRGAHDKQDHEYTSSTQCTTIQNLV